MRLFLIFLILLTLPACTSCGFFRPDSSIKYSYKCLPFSGNVSFAMGQAIIASGGGPSTPSSAVTEAWRAGAQAHLIESFNEMGKLGYTYAGIGMIDPAFNAVWVCFQKVKD